MEHSQSRWKRVANCTKCLTTPISLPKDCLRCRTLQAISARIFKLFWGFVSRTDSSPPNWLKFASTLPTRTCKVTTRKELPNMQSRYSPMIRMLSAHSSSATSKTPGASPNPKKPHNKLCPRSSPKPKGCLATILPRKFRRQIGRERKMHSNSTSS